MKATSLDDVIVAISTPAGSGGIGIVRMSGNGSIDIADKVFKGVKGVKLKDKKSHTVSYGNIYDIDGKTIVDEVLVTVMKAPNTYTKDDVVEVNCHGGPVVVKKILEVLLNSGARLAEAGEFTKRAFLNGRIDLSQAEAVIDVINSKTDMSRQSAVGRLEGRLKEAVHSIRDKLLDMIASIEVAIDYPEHDIEEETYNNMYKASEEVLVDIEKLLSTADRGKIAQEGIETVILGKPNVGKSSLLNRFLEEDRAIVTDIPGTTRDTVEEFMNIDGIPVKIVDTAGIRETGDIVEKMGVSKSKDYAKKADLVLMMLDSSRQLDNEDIEILEFIKDKKSIIILNKSDLDSKLSKEKLMEYVKEDDIISLSVKENKGINELTDRIKDMFMSGDVNISDEVVIGNVRHKNSLYSAKESIKKAMMTIETRMPEDFISMDLQDALKYLGEITGESVDEEIIDRIFSRFCLGK
ncbi:MAG: tRNA uridine-5-carboxymethylaminomethyl(34) synthesis GTPase MnmE [Tyzzerella sp.]|uniref:tRNA modification GTPase MnmE n=1 Tax=Candidatus Fimicola merdigallinarum TaxID=2840819 RepID=A0A9D9H4V9_9FIRM|nr:tRNA uridine-5-carboxymethylaminomethyl(34) synthesis GTPase MnmE [Candidatus Fimicola merdigallinarum]